MTTRRLFLKKTTAVLATGMMLSPFARVLGANDAIRVGVIGMGSKVAIGGMGRKDMQACRKQKGVRIGAICDVDSVNLGYAMDDCREHNEQVGAFRDMRELLDREDIDVAWVTTPNHWHALACIRAARAGKHVFVQKPASHNIFEGRQMVEAARKYGVIVQSSTYTRSMKGFQEAVEFVREGRLGKARYVHAVRFGARTGIGKVDRPTPVPPGLDYQLWCGPAPAKPVMRKNLHYDWHWDWDYGNGELGNWGIHLLDGARIAAGADRMPRRVLSVAGRFGVDDDGRTPNTQIVYWDYEPVPILYEMRGLPHSRSDWKNDRWSDAAMDRFHGKQYATAICCEGGYTLDNAAFDADGKKIRDFTGPLKSARSAFFESVRDNAANPHYAIEEAHLSAGLVHLGNISHRLGRPASAEEIRERASGNGDFSSTWDRMRVHLEANGIDLEKSPATLGAFLTFDPATERFTGESADAANALARRSDRPGFEIPDKF